MAARWPPDQWKDLTLVVAVSGGPDSVALLRALAALKNEVGGSGRLIVAHLNHHLRPESVEDARFVAKLAQALELPYEHADAAVAELAARQGNGIEAAARQARYDFLQAVAQKLGARYVTTAHTADDQVETVLLNIVRGTGLSGLAGMPRARPLGPAVSLIRPLLDVRREAVLKYLDELGQRYCVDVSNASHDFARNRVRHELLPLLSEKYNSDVRNAITRLAQLANDSQNLIDKLADDLLERCAISEIPSQGFVRRSSDQNVNLNFVPLVKIDRHLVREMMMTLWRRVDWPLQDMGFAEWDALADMALPTGTNASRSSPKKRVFPGNIIVERLGDQLRLSRSAN